VSTVYYLHKTCVNELRGCYRKKVDVTGRSDMWHAALAMHHFWCWCNHALRDLFTGHKLLIKQTRQKNALLKMNWGLSWRSVTGSTGTSGTESSQETSRLLVLGISVSAVLAVKNRCCQVIKCLLMHGNDLTDKLLYLIHYNNLKNLIYWIIRLHFKFILTYC
jgi:hypothetical protein